MKASNSETAALWAAYTADRSIEQRNALWAYQPLVGSSAQLGLVSAIEAFNPSQGVPFGAYAGLRSQLNAKVCYRCYRELGTHQQAWEQDHGEFKAEIAKLKAELAKAKERIGTDFVICTICGALFSAFCSICPKCCSKHF